MTKVNCGREKFLIPCFGHPYMVCLTIGNSASPNFLSGGSKIDSQGYDLLTAVNFEAARLEVWGDDFDSLAAALGLSPGDGSAGDVALSEAHAARFMFHLLRRNRWLRWRFPRALSDGEMGRFCRWLAKVGPRKFGLAPAALRKVRGAFRRQSAEKVYEIYLNDPVLQKLYPLGLLPIGQRHFLNGY